MTHTMTPAEVAQHIANVHKKYESKKYDFGAECDELQEQFQGVFFMLDAYEILMKVTEDPSGAETVEYCVSHHKLSRHIYGFDAVGSDDIAESEYFRFDTLREAFHMIADVFSI